MTKKEQFMTFLFVGAAAQDIRTDTQDAQMILHVAAKIPEACIPDNTMNAAKVFLAYFTYAGKRPFRWMLPPPALPQQPGI